LELIGVTMDDVEYSMVAPWMENGNIVEYLRENLQVNPLKLAGTLFHLVYLSVESHHSWRTPRAVFSISMAWNSPTVT